MRDGEKEGDREKEMERAAYGKKSIIMCVYTAHTPTQTQTHTMSKRKAKQRNSNNNKLPAYVCLCECVCVYNGASPQIWNANSGQRSGSGARGRARQQGCSACFVS